MHISLSLLFLFIGSTSAAKEGDFGTFTACMTKNNSLRLTCSYAPCQGSPSFSCELKMNGSTLAKECNYTLPDYPQEKTAYNCTLTRKKRKEEKHLIIDPSSMKTFKPCPDTTGLLLHPAPTLLWPVVILSLWMVLVSDSQTT